MWGSAREVEGGWLLEMVHMFPADVGRGVFLVDVVEVGPAEHAEEEVEVDEGDGDVGGGGGVFAADTFADCLQ